MRVFLHSISKLCRYQSTLRKTSREIPLTSWFCKRGFLPNQHLRTISSGSNVNLGKQRKTETVEFVVKPFGKLIGKFLHKRGDISISALDPHKYPLQDRAFIEVESGGKYAREQLTLSLEGDMINLTSNECRQNTDCIVRAIIPLKFDIDISLSGDSGVAIENFENYDIAVQADKGVCHLKNIKCGSISVLSSGGDIRCEKLLQGNAKLVTAGQGSIHADRVQGLTFEGHTENGDIELQVLYADQSSFSSQAGSLYIKGCQRHAQVQLGRGDLTIGSLEGDLCAVLTNGDADLYVAKHGRVEITAETGNIDMKLPETVETCVDIEGVNIAAAAEFIIDYQEEKKHCIKGVLNLSTEESSAPLVASPPSHLTLKAPTGNVRLACLDWLSTLSLNKALD